MVSVDECAVVDIRRYRDERGYLSVIESGIDVPFNVERVFYTYLVPEAVRGEHAHKRQSQFLFAVSGSVSVLVDDGRSRRTFVLDRPWKGLLIKPGLWAGEGNFSGGAVLMVLTDGHYDDSDYIRDYQEYLEYRRQYDTSAV